MIENARTWLDCKSLESVIIRGRNATQELSWRCVPVQNALVGTIHVRKEAPLPTRAVHGKLTAALSDEFLLSRSRHAAHALIVNLAHSITWESTMKWWDPELILTLLFRGGLWFSVRTSSRRLRRGLHLSFVRRAIQQPLYSGSIGSLQGCQPRSTLPPCD
jgi:hypothetical protein